MAGKEIITYALLVILGVLIGMSFHTGKIQQAVKFPEPVISAYYCAGNSCFLVIRNTGTENVSCSDMSLYADSSKIGDLSDFSDIYGSPCHQFSPGAFQVFKMPDVCKGHDRIILKTEIPGLLDTRLTGYYIYNYIC